MSDSHGKADEFRRGWLLLLAATLGSAAGLSSLPFYSLGLFIQPLGNEYGWSRGDVAISYLYTTLVVAALAPFMGNVIDRVGSRLVALVAIPLLSAVFFTISRFDGSLTQFHLLYALAGLLGVGTTPINYTRAVNGAFDKARGFALGISQAGIAVMAILLPLILVAVISSSGWRAGYLTLALLMLIPWPFVLVGLRKREQGPVQTVAATALPSEPINRSDLFRSRIFWTVGLTFFAASIAVTALVVHMVPLLSDKGLTPGEAAGIASIVGFGVLVGRLLTGYLIDRFFAPYVAAVLFTLTAIGCLVLLYGPSGMALLAAALIGVSLGAEADLIAYLTARYFGMARYAFVYGFIYAMFLIGAAVGPTLAGRAYDVAGNYTVAIWSVTTLLVAAALAVLTLPKFDKHASPVPATP